MIQTAGNIAERFVQHSKNADGSAARSFEQMNDNTKQRLTAENTMKAVAVNNGKSLNAIVTKALLFYPDQLSAYVAAHGESPIKYDLVKLALQAVLLRAEDIAKQAKAIDTSDDDALADIENAEMAAQSNNTPDNETVLSTDAQAAMKIAIDHMKDVYEANGGNPTLENILSSLKSFAISKGNTTNEEANYFDLPGLANTYPDTSNNPATGFPTISAGPAPQTNTAGIVNTGSGSGILDTIGSILSGIGTVAGEVKDVAGQVGDAGTAVHNAIGSVGASSIQQYITQHKTTILFAVLGIALLLFLIIYAARKSS